MYMIKDRLDAQQQLDLLSQFSTDCVEAAQAEVAPFVTEFKQWDNGTQCRMIWNVGSMTVEFNDSGHCHLSYSARIDESGEFGSIMALLDYADQVFEPYLRLGRMYP